MSYEYVSKFNAAKKTPAARGKGIIKNVMIHHWGIDGQKIENVVNFFVKGSGGTSAHYVVEANKVYCLVTPKDIAWHAGNWAHNLTDVGIECRPEMSAEDLETVCELVAELKDAYGDLKVIGHKDVKNTACPGRYYKMLKYIDQRSDELRKGSGKKPQATATTYTVKRGDTLSGIAAKYKTTVNKLVAANKLRNPDVIRVGQKIKIK